MKPEIISFDLGNVFMTYDRVFSTVENDLGLDRSFFDEYDPYDKKAMVGELSITEIWQQVCLDRKMQQYSNYNIIESWVSDYEPIRSMHTLSVRLKEKYSLGVISNLYLGFWDEIIKQNCVPTGIDFHPVIISAEVKCRKPDTSIYYLAEKKSGRSGSEIFFIDDKVENIDTAKKLGWQTFLFDYKNPQESVAELSQILL